MKKGLLFGAGVIGKRALPKLSGIYEIIAFSDNNSRLWGSEYCGLKVIKPVDILQLDADVIICSDYYAQIYEQLKGMGVNHIVGVDPFSYQLYTIENNKMMYPVQRSRSPKIKKVLFVQAMPCIRTFKIAYAISQKGIQVALAYLINFPQELLSMFPQLFDEIYPINSFSAFVDFLNHSDYDILHCSNEPDFLTNIALCSNKCVVHDTHDMVSMEYEADREMQTLEFVANKKSCGTICITEKARDYAVKRFELELSKTLIVSNLPLEKMHPRQYLEKLSKKDGQIHCVYEGNLSDQPKMSRYLKDLWNKITAYGIHIHFYTGFASDYCRKISKDNPYLHYEGSRTAEELAVLNTQYDCGLLAVNVTKENRDFLNSAVPNKLFEYIDSGIPVAASDLDIYKSFFEKYSVGACLNMDENIEQQINKIIDIKVDRDFLIKNELTMDKAAEEIIEFYQRVSGRD